MCSVCRRLILPMALLACCGAKGLAQAPAFSNQLSLDKKPVATVVLLNTTQAKVTYRIWYADRERSAAEYALESGKCHFYREPKSLACSVGDSPAVNLENGGFYEFRIAADQRAVLLVRLGTGTEGERDRIAELEKENRRLQEKIAELSRRPNGLAAPLELKSSPTQGDLGSLPLKNGRAETELSVTLTHTGSKPLSLRVEADAGLECGRIRVEPAEVEADSGQPMRLRLGFENIPAGRSLAGRLTFSGTAAHATLRHEVPFKGTLTLKDVAPSADAKTLTVITWPSGADVYITAPAGRERPWERRFLGTTPIQWRPGAGEYQLMLAPPRSEQGSLPFAGRWACWDGQLVPLGGPIREGLQVHVQKKDSEPALVRAIWLPAEGVRIDRLARATQGAPDLFSPPPFEDFFRFAVRTLAEADEVLREEEAKKLHDFLRKTGYLRLQLTAETAVDLDFRAGRDPVLAARGVRLPR